MTITHCGRRFSAQDLELMRQAAQDYAVLGITEIARTVCEWLDWTRPNGQLKNHECRLLLERRAMKASCRCRHCARPENVDRVFPR